METHPNTDEPADAVPRLPTEARQGSAAALLRSVAPHALAVTCAEINGLRALAEDAEASQERSTAITARTAAARLSARLVELAVGKQVHVTATITNRDSLPDWDRLPAEAQAHLQEAFKAIDLQQGPDGTFAPAPQEDP